MFISARVIIKILNNVYLCFKDLKITDFGLNYIIL